MTSQPTKHVVVGVDDTPAGQRGVRYAATEARRRGTSLSIVHVIPGYSLGAGLPNAPDDVLRRQGTKIVEDAREYALTVAPDLEIDTTLVTGRTTVHGLADEAEQAALLVLGAERRSFAGRVWTGDVVGGVAARAHCPVVTVPPEWEPRHRHGRVVVGVKDPEHAGDLVVTGLQTAHEQDAELVVIHAWKLPSGYDDIVGNRQSAEQYGREQTTKLEPLVQEHRGEYPEVTVKIEVLHMQPAQALIQASGDADLLIVSRPHRGGALHHLGGVGRAVLQESACPVQVRPAPEEG